MDKQIKKIEPEEVRSGIAFDEFMAKVKELGGWIENDKVRFATPNAALKFENWLADCNA